MKMPRMPQLGGGGLTRALVIAVVGVIAIAGLTALLTGGGEKTVTAMFPRTVSVYEGSDVRVLGVKIGTVDTVEPAGTSVKVTMTYDETVKVPQDVKAAIIAPSVVGDRYVQLTPVYQGGDVLEDNASLGLDRTAVPLELDQIYQNLSDLAVALGPDGANKDGSLTRLLRSTARNFGGQGEQFNETIRNLSRFTTTLDNRKEDIFGTAREIEVFVNALEENDQTVRDFNDSLQSAAGLLEDERDDLAAALRNLGTAMTAVRGFVNENEDALSRNIKGLVKVTDVFVKRRAELDETLATAPTALSNLFHTYNPSAGTLDTRTNPSFNEQLLLENPALVLCEFIGIADQDGEACEQIKDRLPASPAGRAATSGPGSAPSPPPARGVVEVEPIDTTLAGILGEER
jgi:phospholipid/cholesterol/gamma-HCH transport system substrate-binding protein